nr:putative pyrophosphatase/phosphodiesterase [Quercus suber]
MSPTHQEYEKVSQAGSHHPVQREDPEDDGLSSSPSSDDETATLHRSSADVRRHDRETLTAEEEAERLLTGARAPRVKRERKRRKSRRKVARVREEKEVMFRMEEGAERDSSRETLRSSDSGTEGTGVDLKAMRKRGRKRSCVRCCKTVSLYLLVVVVFLALLFGAWRATIAGRRRAHQGQAGGKYTAQTLSNGTHTFAPTTILISLDGFRADFLHRNITPTLSRFIREGVSPKYMMPSFPSVTFPNHFTLVTGMYPEAHGIVGNTFWDPNTQKEFYYTDPEKSMKPEWWTAEPIWETVELAGVRSAIHMWPGSEAHLGRLEPAFVDKFNMDEPLDSKVDRILGWLDLPGPNDTDASEATPRPQLIAAYVPDVDADGHQYGPNSTYIRSTIRETDGMLGKLFQGIDERNLTQLVNIVVVSDHGMATTDIDRLIQLEDVLDTDLIEHTDGWPLYGLRPYDPSPEHLQQLYDEVYAKSQLPQYKGSFEVYLRDTNMPVRYHFSKNARIAPLWLVPTTGWAIVAKSELDLATAKERGLVYHPRGLHGYDHEHPLMRAIFVARGPAFPHARGSKLAPFQNTEVYNIICDSLGITPVQNNGTLRLPLVTQGLHDFASYASAEDLPGDFAAHDDVADEASAVPNLNDQLVDPADPYAPVEPAVPYPDVSMEPDTEEIGVPPRPEVHDKAPEDEELSAVNQWLQWMKAKFEALTHWASASSKDGKGEDGDLANESNR